MLGRRSFLGVLIGAMTLDPERLLWTPGKKLISIPKPRIIQIPSYYSSGGRFAYYDVDSGDLGI